MSPQPGPLFAVSPLDGRYADRTAPLREYASEAALMRARVRVEVEYLLALSDIDVVPLDVDPELVESLRDTYRDFGADEAELVKQIETTGTRGYGPTNHDVKAVEYFLRERTPECLHPWLHFGLTSEDVNNLAYRLLIGDAMESVVLPALRTVRESLVEMAREYASLPMLARTHGQPATPTTFGKEMAVFASRLGRATGSIADAIDSLGGKLAGASGTYAAHHVAYPTIDWRSFAASFVESLGLEFIPLTTQVNPGDDLASLFDAIRRANRVLIDLDRDMWLYVSQRYLGQESDPEETGSSTMPHKVNPIDFENSEGNLSKANSDLSFLGSSITTSRLQRDLSDSTIKRNIGGALAYCLLGYTKTAEGLDTVVPNEVVMAEDLRENPAVLAEAVQTILRREGHADAYELVKDATRGETLTMEDFDAVVDELDVPESVATELRSLDPEEYVGLGAELASSVEEE
ncbi:MAG: adenylosuccinate lyase [Halodesulfurarchaeum sp.]